MICVSEMAGEFYICSNHSRFFPLFWASVAPFRNRICRDSEAEKKQLSCLNFDKNFENFSLGFQSSYVDSILEWLIKKAVFSFTNKKSQ